MRIKWDDYSFLTTKVMGVCGSAGNSSGIPNAPSNKVLSFFFPYSWLWISFPDQLTSVFIIFTLTVSQVGWKISNIVILSLICIVLIVQQTHGWWPEFYGGIFPGNGVGELLIETPWKCTKRITFSFIKEKILTLIRPIHLIFICF